MTGTVATAKACAPLILLLAGISAGARADERPPAPTTLSLNGISPDNLAGLINFCLETRALPPPMGNPVLDALIAKYHSVMMTGGNLDYAVGTAGMIIVGSQRFDVRRLPQESQRALCESTPHAAQPFL